MPTIAHHFADVNITATFAAQLARPAAKLLAIKFPHIHISPSRTNGYGLTTIINNRPHVWLYPWRHKCFADFIFTLGHELIHCWQFTNRIYCNGETFNRRKCEAQAYKLEPLAAAALAAAVLQQAKSASSKAA